MKNRRVVLLVLDGVGVGSMDDCLKFRPQDVGYNTVKSVIFNPVQIPQLSKLGLYNIANNNFENNYASNGQIKLLHKGADTFFGHNEIMGSKPPEIIISQLRTFKNDLLKTFFHKKIKATYQKGYILVKNKVVVADNIETDKGLVINVTGATSEVSFDQILKISKIVRKVVTTARVIALGGKATSTKQIINSIVKTKDKRIGVDTPRSNIYKEGYQCVHMGYMIDTKKQIQSILKSRGYEVSLIGKMQDIISGKGYWRKRCVSSLVVMNTIISRLKQQQNGLIAATVQESDLAGHSQDKNKFLEVLKIVDTKLKLVIKKLGDDDILIITSDHGNDPTNNSSSHTREYAPLIIYGKKHSPENLGILNTLSCIANKIDNLLI